MEAWLQRQKPDTHQKFNKVSNVILAQVDFWKNLDLCCQIFEPPLEDLRVSDGIKGGTPAILYNMCLALDKLYIDPYMEDITDSRRTWKTSRIQTEEFCLIT